MTEIRKDTLSSSAWPSQYLGSPRAYLEAKFQNQSWFLALSWLSSSITFRDLDGWKHSPCRVRQGVFPQFWIELKNRLVFLYHVHLTIWPCCDIVNQFKIRWIDWWKKERCDKCSNEDILRLSKPTRNLWYHTIQHQNGCFSRLVLSCQNQRSNHLNFQYIYLISYRNAKKANSIKWICPFLKNDNTTILRS